jgi:hypothetical protein
MTKADHAFDCNELVTSHLINAKKQEKSRQCARRQAQLPKLHSSVANSPFHYAKQKRRKTCIRSTCCSGTGSNAGSNRIGLKDQHSSGPSAGLQRQMVRMKGLEPSRELPHSDLNAARLPIPPHPHVLIWSGGI